MQGTLVKNIIRFKYMYLFLLPAILTVIIFSYKPMVGIIMAFQDFDIYSGYTGSPFVGFKHFQAFLESSAFSDAFINTVAINFLMFAFGFPIPIVFALLINELKGMKFKRVSQTITYLPHFISWIVVSTMVYRMLDQDTGSINNLINFFGGERVGFMREPNYFWAVLTTTSIWKELGWNSIIYLAALAGIDPQLYEAAMVDGAGRFRRLISITLPGIAPTIGICIILSMGTLFSGHGSFDAIYNMRNMMVMDKAEVLDTYALKEGVNWARYSYAAAIGITQSFVGLTFVVLSNTLSKKISGYGVF